MSKLDISSSGTSGIRTDKTMRKCMVTNEVRLKSTMIRFVRDPEGMVVPDFAGKLPGRGCWISATRRALIAAFKKGTFKTCFQDRKAEVRFTSPQEFADYIAEMQKQRVMDAFGLCRRAGDLITGFEKVQRAVNQAGLDDLLILAADAGADGSAKLSNVAKRNQIQIVRAFDSECLSVATGFDGIGYLYVSHSKKSKSHGQPSRRLMNEIKKFLSLSQVEADMSNVS